MFSFEFCEFFRGTYVVDDLQTADPKTPVPGSLFNKVASLAAWRSLTILEKGCSTGISLWILWKI